MKRMQADEGERPDFRQSVHDAEFTNPAGLYNMANNLQKITKAEAIEVLYLLAIDAGVTDAFLNYGTFLWDEGRPRDAMAPLEKAFEANDPYAASTLGQIHLELNDAARAIEWFNRSGDNPAVPLRLAYAHRAAGDHQAALTILRKSKDTNAEAAVELVLSGDIEGQEAVTLLEHHASTGSADVLIPLANLYGETGREADEITALRKAVDAGEPNAIHNLGYVLWHAGYRQEGRKYLKAAARQGDQLASRVLHGLRRKRSPKSAR